MISLCKSVRSRGRLFCLEVPVKPTVEFPKEINRLKEEGTYIAKAHKCVWKKGKQFTTEHSRFVTNSEELALRLEMCKEDQLESLVHDAMLVGTIGARRIIDYWRTNKR
jgi:hypothetical protein